jgi:hypothetical protein
MLSLNKTRFAQLISDMNDIMAHNSNLHIKDIPEDLELRFQSELQIPTTRPDPFASFSPNAIKSSLQSNYSPSLRVEQLVNFRYAKNPKNLPTHTTKTTIPKCK